MALSASPQVTRDAWLAQFAPQDRGNAARLLAAVRDVSGDEFRDSMTELLTARIAAVPGHVALFVEAERGHRHGRAHRLFKEAESKPRRAFGSAGPPVVQPLRTVDPEVGSEGLVANIVSQVHRQHRKRVSIHPGPDLIRSRHVRRFVLVTDFIGSGDRAFRYLDAAWRVRSVRSWWSARATKGLSFEVVAFSGTEAGRERVEAHPTRPTVHLVEGCPTVAGSFDVPADRERMVSLCAKYAPKGVSLDWMGYGEAGALITFAHGMPNNAPILFWKASRSAKAPWCPLYPERITSRRRKPLTAPGEVEAMTIDLWRITARQVLASPRFRSAPLALRDAVLVLLALNRFPFTPTALAARTRLKVERTNEALGRARRYGWIDNHCHVTERGRRELVRLALPVPERVPFEDASLYVPRSLRAPRSSR